MNTQIEKINHEIAAWFNYNDIDDDSDRANLVAYIIENALGNNADLYIALSYYIEPAIDLAKEVKAAVL